MANNDNNVVTVGGLKTFLNNLKTQCFYTRSDMNTLLANRAYKNGSADELFSASYFKMHYDSNPVEMRVGSGYMLSFSYDENDTHHAVTLNLNNGGSIITTADLNPYSKANLVSKEVFINGTSFPSVMRDFVSDPVISTFRYLIPLSDLDAGDMYADAGTSELPKSFKAYNIGNPVGTVVYLGSAQINSLSESEDSVGMVSSLPKGFYIVTKSVVGTSTYKVCDFLCQPSLYALYYCISDGFFCFFPSVDSLTTIAISGGGGGTGDYTEATDEDINGLIYT